MLGASGPPLRIRLSTEVGGGSAEGRRKVKGRLRRGRRAVRVTPHIRKLKIDIVWTCRFVIGTCSFNCLHPASSLIIGKSEGNYSS